MSSILLIFGAPYSGMTLLSKCLHILGILPPNHQPDADTINNLLLQDLGLPQHTPALPTGWLNSTAANKAKERIHQLLHNMQRETRKPLPCADWNFAGGQYLNQQILLHNPLLMALWHSAFKEASITPYGVLMVRHPYEVALSLQARHHLDLTRGNILWLAHIRTALNIMEALSCSQADSSDALLPVSCFPLQKRITYDQLLADPISVLSPVLHSLPAPDRVRAITDVLNHVQPSLKNCHASDFPESDQAVCKPFARIYDQLRSGQDLESTNNEIIDTLLRALPGHDDPKVSFPMGNSPSVVNNRAQSTGLFATVTFPSSKHESGVSHTVPLIEGQWQKMKTRDRHLLKTRDRHLLLDSPPCSQIHFTCSLAQPVLTAFPANNGSS